MPAYFFSSPVLMFFYQVIIINSLLLTSTCGYLACNNNCLYLYIKLCCDYRRCGRSGIGSRWWWTSCVALLASSTRLLWWPLSTASLYLPLSCRPGYLYVMSLLVSHCIFYWLSWWPHCQSDRSRVSSSFIFWKTVLKTKSVYNSDNNSLMIHNYVYYC